MKVSPIFLILFIFNWFSSHGQTCCTGGVPHIGALRIPQIDKNQLQVGLAYVLNHNNHLIANDQVIETSAIKRRVNTILMQSDYGLSNKISLSALMPYIFQIEEIEFNGDSRSFTNEGLGDISFWGTYKNDLGRFYYSASFGLKVPTGNTDQRDEGTDIILPFSFQNGSGSYDFGIIGFTKYSLDEGRKNNWINQVSIRINTKGKKFDAHPEYRFGHSFHFNSVYSRSIIVSDRLLNLLTGLNYQYKTKDLFTSEFENSNTGGHWVNLLLGGNLALSPKSIISINGLIPLYRNLNGLQLSTSWLLNIGVSYVFR